MSEFPSLSQNTIYKALRKKDIRVNEIKVSENVSVYEGVEVEDHAFLGPSVVFTNDLTPRAEYPKGHDNYLKTMIKKGATIGANATIVCGNTIGEYAMVGAGAVVTKDVKPFTLVVGNPAYEYAKVDEKGNIIEKF